MADEITDRLHKFILTKEEKDSIEIDVQDITLSMENCEKGPLAEGANSTEKKTNDTVQGTANVIDKDLHNDDDNNLFCAGHQEDGHTRLQTMLNQNENNVLINKHMPKNGSPSKQLQQHVELEEPVFADTIGGREAQEYYWLAKMDLGDTFDHADIERWFNKQREAESRLKDLYVTNQMMQKKAAKLDAKT
ncbi:hypothetical protein MTR67_043969 [Solanum verrucosum]|uniref:Uncharacterized protein n=1 Tax=Solanum verrucosum TaxID=315347 RepID=A0AAF0ZVM2_SOLVR|nr:hypothetical protein MTR67_043969 [Solanum verrucosum]